MKTHRIIGILFMLAMTASCNNDTEIGGPVVFSNTVPVIFKDANGNLPALNLPVEWNSDSGLGLVSDPSSIEIRISVNGQQTEACPFSESNLLTVYRDGRIDIGNYNESLAFKDIFLNTESCEINYNIVSSAIFGDDSPHTISVSKTRQQYGIDYMFEHVSFDGMTIAENIYDASSVPFEITVN